jgi:hypothetical protein
MRLKVIQNSTSQARKYELNMLLLAKAFLLELVFFQTSLISKKKKKKKKKKKLKTKPNSYVVNTYICAYKTYAQTK